MSLGQNIEESYNIKNIEHLFAGSKNARILFSRKFAGMNQLAYAEMIGINSKTYKACESNVNGKGCNKVNEEVALLIEGKTTIPWRWVLFGTPGSLPVFRVIGLEKSLMIANGIIFMNERRRLGLTRDELAKLVGYAGGTHISRIESGESGIPPSRLEAFKAVGFDASKLSFGVKKQKVFKKAVLSDATLSKIISLYKKGESMEALYKEFASPEIKYNTFFVKIKRAISKHDIKEEKK
jgi:DNA-binding XRE family transcriptional regulator